MISRLLKTVLRPVLKISAIRQLLVRYHYRQVIGPAERVMEYRKDTNSLDDSYWVGLLRKHAHIVDKGLHCMDFERGRGQTAFQAAQQALSQIRSEASRADPSVVWAIQKLKDYEKIQQSGERYPSSPFVRTTCSYDHLLDVIHTRRSVRWYRPQSVSDDVIYKIVDVINWSPTSCNRQTAKVFATTDPVMAQKCIELCSGSSGFSRYVPLFIAFSSDIRVYEMAHEVMLPYIDVALGVQNCCLVAHTLGLSLTLLTWAQHTDDQDQQLRRILSIPDHYQIIVNAAGGYPIGSAHPPSRKNLNETLILHKTKQGDKEK